MRAGTPATVLFAGTGFKTTEPAAMREQLPISILPSTFAPDPIKTPQPIFGWRSCHVIVTPLRSGYLVGCKFAFS